MEGWLHGISTIDVSNRRRKNQSDIWKESNKQTDGKNRERDRDRDRQAARQTQTHTDTER